MFDDKEFDQAYQSLQLQDPKFGGVLKTPAPQTPTAPPEDDDFDRLYKAQTDPKAAIDYYSQKHGVDPAFAHRIAQAESGYNQKAVSPKGARGLMQLMPETAKRLGVNPDNLSENAEGGIRYLRELLDKHKGDQRLAAADYNSGAVDKYGAVPPYKETQNYVAKTAGDDDFDRLYKETYQTPAPPPTTPASPEQVSIPSDDPKFGGVTGTTAPYSPAAIPRPPRQPKKPTAVASTINPAYQKALADADIQIQQWQQEYNELANSDDNSQRAQQDLRALKARIDAGAEALVARPESFQTVQEHRQGQQNARFSERKTALADAIMSTPENRIAAYEKLASFGPLSDKERQQLGVSQADWKSYLDSFVTGVGEFGAKALGLAGRISDIAQPMGIVGKIKGENPRGELTQYADKSLENLHAYENLYNKENVGGHVLHAGGELLPELGGAVVAAPSTLAGRLAYWTGSRAALGYGAGEPPEQFLKEGLMAAPAVLGAEAFGGLGRAIAPEIAQYLGNTPTALMVSSQIPRMVSVVGNSTTNGLITKAAGGDEQAITTSVVLATILSMAGRSRLPEDADFGRAAVKNLSEADRVAGSSRFQDLTETVAEINRRAGSSKEEAIHDAARIVDTARRGGEQAITDLENAFRDVAELPPAKVEPTTKGAQPPVPPGAQAPASRPPSGPSANNTPASVAKPEGAMPAPLESTTTPDSSPIRQHMPPSGNYAGNEVDTGNKTRTFSVPDRYNNNTPTNRDVSVQVFQNPETGRYYVGNYNYWNDAIGARTSTGIGEAGGIRTGRDTRTYFDTPEEATEHGFRKATQEWGPPVNSSETLKPTTTPETSGRPMATVEPAPVEHPILSIPDHPADLADAQDTWNSLQSGRPINEGRFPARYEAVQKLYDDGKLTNADDVKIAVKALENGLDPEESMAAARVKSKPENEVKQVEAELLPAVANEERMNIGGQERRVTVNTERDEASGGATVRRVKVFDLDENGDDTGKYQILNVNSTRVFPTHEDARQAAFDFVWQQLGDKLPSAKPQHQLTPKEETNAPETRVGGENAGSEPIRTPQGPTSQGNGPEVRGEEGEQNRSGNRVPETTGKPEPEVVHVGQIFDYRNQRYRVDSVDDEFIRATDLSGKEGQRLFKREDFDRVTTIPGRKIETGEGQSEGGTKPVVTGTIQPPTETKAVSGGTKLVESGTKPAETTDQRIQRITREGHLNDQVTVGPDDPRYADGNPISGVPNRRTVAQRNLAEILPPGTTSVYHETSLDGLKQLIPHYETKAGSKPNLDVSNDPDLALGQSGKGYVIEIDPTLVNGRSRTGKPGLALIKATGGTSGEFTINRSVVGAIRSITAPNRKGLESLRKIPGIEKRFDFDNPEKAERGLKVNRTRKGPSVSAETKTTETETKPVEARTKTQPVETEVKPKTLKIKKKVAAEETKSISQFVRSRGGFKADNDLQGEINRLRKHESGTTGLFTKNGLSPDYMREAAVEAGYLPEDATISDLMDAIEDDIAGKKTYSIHRDQNIIDKELDKEYDRLQKSEDASQTFRDEREVIETELGDPGSPLGRAFDAAVDDGDAQLRQTAGEYFFSPETIENLVQRATDIKENGVEAADFQESGSAERTATPEEFQAEIDRAEAAGKLETEKNKAKAKEENDKELLRIGMQGGRANVEETKKPAPKDTLTPDLFNPQEDLFSEQKGSSSTVGDPNTGDINPEVYPPDPVVADYDAEAMAAQTLANVRMPQADAPIPGYEKGKVSSTDVIKSYEKVLEDIGRPTPIRTGRMGRAAKTARGFYKPHEEVIRLVIANNIPTAAHEVGHALQKVIYASTKASALKTLPTKVKRELIQLGKALYGKTRPAAGYTGEGFAEFMRYYLTRDDVTKVAPETEQWFRALLAKETEIRSGLQNARRTTDTYRNEGARNRAEANIVRGPKLQDRLDKLKKAVNRFPTMFIDEFTPLIRLSREVQAAKGPLAPSTDPAIVASALRGVAPAKVDYMVHEGMIDFASNRTGPSLHQALAPIKDQREAFTQYLWAKRAQERLLQGKNPGMSQEDADYLVQALETPEFQLAAQMVYDWNNGVLEYVKQMAPEFADAIDAIQKKSGNYIPLNRAFDEPQGGNAAKLGASSGGLKRMKGSGRRILDPFPQMIANAEKLVSMSHKRRVLKTIFDLAQTEGLGHLIEEVPRDRVPNNAQIWQVAKQLEAAGADMTGVNLDDLVTFFTPASTPKGQDPIFPVMKDGQMKWYQLDPDLYNTLSGVDLYRMGPIANVLLGAPARTFRLGTTGLRASFSLFTNPARDMQTFWMQTKSTKNPAKLFGMYVSAMAEALNPKRVAGHRGPGLDAFMRLGAQLGQPLGADIAITRNVAKRLFQGKAMVVVTSPLNTLRELLGATEAGSRVAEIKSMAEDVGWDGRSPMTFDQSIQLALAAKQVTVDFSAAGSIGKIINQAVPFFNANIQGPRQTVRTFKEKPGRTILRGLLGLTALTLLLWWMNKDKKWYRDMPDREKFMYWNMEAPGDRVLQIPRGFEYGNTFAMMPEALIDSWYAKDKKEVTAMFGQFYETTVPDITPQLIRPFKEQWQNRVDFFDRPIVPRGEEDLPPGEQRGPYTSAIAKFLGKQFPDRVSPRRVDALIRAVFGGVGGDIASGSSLKLQEASDIPVLGKAFRRGGTAGSGSKSIETFYDRYSQAEKLKASEDRPETADQEKYRGDMEDAAQALRYLRSEAQEAKTPDEKRQFQRAAVAIASAAVEQPVPGEDQSDDSGPSKKNLKTEFINRLRAGEDLAKIRDDAARAIKDGNLKPNDMNQILDKGLEARFTEKFKALNSKEAINVFEGLSPEKQKENLSQLRSKRATVYDLPDNPARQQLLDRYDLVIDRLRR